MARLLFVTGTDTGVGKTFVTALLLTHLRSRGVDALAAKPFCTGPRDDVKLLQKYQAGKASDAEINPFHFALPAAPLVAARREGREVRLRSVLTNLRALQKRCDYLLVEGAGGLMVPLGPGYTVVDLIDRLQCDVCVVARNQLGTINHTALTVDALKRRQRGRARVVVVLNQSGVPDETTSTNASVLREMLGKIDVLEIPARKLGADDGELKTFSKKLKKVLARIVG